MEEDKSVVNTQDIKEEATTKGRIQDELFESESENVSENESENAIENISESESEIESKRKVKRIKKKHNEKRQINVVINDIQYQIDVGEDMLFPIILDKKKIPIQRPLNAWQIYQIKEENIESDKETGAIYLDDMIPPNIHEKWKELEPQDKALYYASACIMQVDFEKVLEKLRTKKSSQYVSLVEILENHKKALMDDGVSFEIVYHKEKRPSRGRSKRESVENKSVESFLDSASKRVNTIATEEQCITSILNDFLETMHQRTKEDFEANQENKPAVGRLRMLAEVTQIFVNNEYQGRLIELGIQSHFAEWLSTLPDGSQPNVKIRTEIVRLLKLIPIHFLSVTQLIKSKIGFRQTALVKDPRETPDNKRSITSLVESWSRYILHANNQRQQQSYTETIQTNMLPRKSISDDTSIVGKLQKELSLRKKAMATSRTRR